MNFSEIARRQLEADERRGFNKHDCSAEERLAQLTRDTVGLVGEIGEFANLLKKVELASRIEGYVGPSLEEVSSELREELADSIIYIIRLSSLLGGEIESDIIAKMTKNDQRYGYLEG